MTQEHIWQLIVDNIIGRMTRRQGRRQESFTDHSIVNSEIDRHHAWCDLYLAYGII